MPKLLQKYSPITRIRDTVHFAEKAESPALQIADICAFVIKRYLAGARDGDRFYRILAGTHEIKCAADEHGGYRVIWWDRGGPTS